MKKRLETKVVRFKVTEKNCRTFSDPNDLGRKRYFAQIPVDEIHRARIDYGPNPRNQNMETKVAEAIDNLVLQIGNRPDGYIAHDNLLNWY